MRNVELQLLREWGTFGIAAMLARRKSGRERAELPRAGIGTVL